VLQKIPRVLQHLYAVITISFGCVFFRAPTVEYSLKFIGTLLGLQLRHSRMNISIKHYLDTKVIIVIIFAIFGSSGLLSAFIRVLKDVPNRFSNKHVQMLADLVLGISWIVTFVSLFLLCIIAISSGLYNPFIYF
jgi:alginate O-acetyltransferase complex protein AlgI